jgi:hypothetical protein
MIANVAIVPYAFVVVVDVHAAAIVAVAPSIHVVAAVALAFASVDDVVVSYRN